MRFIKALILIFTMMPCLSFADSSDNMVNTFQVELANIGYIVPDQVIELSICSIPLGDFPCTHGSKTYYIYPNTNPNSFTLTNKKGEYMRVASASAKGYGSFTIFAGWCTNLEGIRGNKGAAIFHIKLWNSDSACYMEYK